MIDLLAGSPAFGLLGVLVALLIGGLPSHRMVERFWSIDLASGGSGNRGAGNALATAGLEAGVLLAVLDGLKGLLPVLVSRALGFDAVLQVAVGLAAVAGNDWPIWRKGRGGRGLAASVGVVIGISPPLIVWPGLWAAAGWMIGGGLAGFVGWGLLPLLSLVTNQPEPIQGLTIGLAGILIVRRAQGNGGIRWPGLLKRVVFDRDPRATTDPSRPLAASSAAMGPLMILLVGFPAYMWLGRRLGAQFSVTAVGALFLAAGAVSELLAKWVFGELFREGFEDGNRITRPAAFRAALVGTGIARLIPAGGAITPAAMAWSVRGSSPRAVGAALRATVLNYSALMAATGGGLLWVSARSEVNARRGAATLGVGLLIVGGGILVSSAHLRSLIRIAPRRFRERLASGLVDHNLTRRSVALLVTRVGLEAATLGLSLRAFGVHLAPSQVISSFGIAQLIGGIPGTPGGLGITEAGLIGALGFFGVGTSVGASPVLAFRLLSYWLPAVIGVAAGGMSFFATRNRPGSQRPASSSSSDYPT